MSKPKEPGSTISFKMKSAASKEKVTSFLKGWALQKGITQAEALESLIDTTGAYGELSRLTVQGLNGFTATVGEKLDAIHLELLALNGVIPRSAEHDTDDGEYLSANDDFHESENEPLMDTRSDIQIKRGFNGGKRFAR